MFLSFRGAHVTTFGAAGFNGISNFGKSKLAFLRRFRPFKKGTPTHGQLGEIFAALNAEAFQQCFINWVAALTELGPELVVPGHCTGWRAQHALAAALPDAWVPSSSGSGYRLTGLGTTA